jgi:hypothetical protein
MMDRQTKMAISVMFVLIAFCITLWLYGTFSGWYEGGYD